MSLLGSIIINPLMPLWLLALCLVAFSVMAWRTYARCTLSLNRRILLFSLRILAFLILCVLIAQPVYWKVDVIGEKPVLGVLVDESASMTDSVPGVEKTRAARVKEFLSSSAFASVQDMCEVVYYRFGDTLRRCTETEMKDAEYSSGQSRVIAAIKDARKALQVKHPFGMIVLTDGLDTSGLAVSDQAWDIPLIIPELEDGSQVHEDTRIEYSITLPDGTASRRVVKGWNVSIMGNVNRLHGDGKASFPVLLMLNDTEIERQVVEFDPGAKYAQVQFHVTPDVLGSHVYRLKIAPSEDTNLNNNQADVVLDVTDESKRVLYLEGLARPDFKFMKRALQREDGFEASVYLRMANGVFMNFEEQQNKGNAGRSLASLLKPEELKKYNVVILGELEHKSLSAEQIKALCDYVEGGGGLLLAGGARSYGANGYLGDDVFGKISPIVSEKSASMKEGKAVPVVFTAAGRAENAFLKLATDAEFSPVQSIWSPVKLGTGAVSVLETKDGQPLLASRRFGTGRVCILLSNTLYSMRLKGGRSSETNLYDRLISQTVFWMIPSNSDNDKGEGIQLLMARETAEVKQTISIGALAPEQTDAKAMQCIITGSDKESKQYPMVSSMLDEKVGLSKPKNGFLSELRLDKPGTYFVQIQKNDGTHSDKKTLIISEPYQELTGAQIDRAVLTLLAETSGGRWIPQDKLRENPLAGIAIPHTSRETVTETSVWNRWEWLLPLMMIFCAEWYFRRHWDMV